MGILTKVKVAVARRKLNSMDIIGTDSLEKLIHSRFLADFKKSQELRDMVGKDSLDEITAEDVNTYQLYKFRESMRYAMENSHYYKKKYEAAGITPDDIKTLADISKVPFTDPDDLAENSMAFCAVSQGKVMRAFTTSGTTGNRKRVFFTQNDVLNIVDSIAAAVKSVGMTKDDTLQVMFPAVSAWDPGLMMDLACKLAGLNSSVSSTADVDEQIKNMKDNKTTYLIGLTSFIYRITMLAKDKYDLGSIGVKTIICSAEPLPEIMRKQMIEAWGCPVLAQYGMTEMGLATAIECAAYDGMHTSGAYFFVEAVDPVTGESKGYGESGELIWTSLVMEGTPLIRYRSRDISQILPAPCNCGCFSTVRRVAKIQGRLDAQTKIGYGQKIFPALFDEVLLAVPGVLSYKLTLTHEGYKDKLKFVLEYKGDEEEGHRQVEAALMSLDEIKDALDNDLIEIPEVSFIEAGSIEFVPKSKAIVDLRENYDVSST